MPSFSSYSKLLVYLSRLIQQSIIESQFINSPADNSNAGVCLGCVSSVAEACKWLTYTSACNATRSPTASPARPLNTTSPQRRAVPHRVQQDACQLDMVYIVGSFGCSCYFYEFVWLSFSFQLEGSLRRE